ncbi:hypothetical protein [Phaeobacter sp. 11ANDIMAR09]|uniref:hypothetical protein n=1 Tax=Phaeobacter sp. 11ANDIMAR09 TaxID=1225647 RepID=UPI0006C8BB71|nr:hypothetical protein [Phaeobacter sp. 11ANDIMAR09]
MNHLGYAQYLRTVTRFTQNHQLTDPLLKDDILDHHRHLRVDLDAKSVTIKRQIISHKSYFA